MRAWISLAVMAAIAVSLPACKKKDTNTVDDSAYDAIVTAAGDQLNAPGVAIYQTLFDANAKPQVGWDTLTIPVANQTAPEPVNWWLMQKGMISLEGAQFASRPVFSLTDAGRALVGQPAQDWFGVKLGADKPKVDCTTAEAMAVKGCAVVLTITPSLTDPGTAALGAKTLAPITLHAIVFRGADDWQVPTLLTDGDSLEDVALTTILGSKDARAAARAAAEADLTVRMRSLAASQIIVGPPPPPPAIDEIPAPVAAAPQSDLATDLGRRRGGLPK